jgi:hypothetical protein
MRFSTIDADIQFLIDGHLTQVEALLKIGIIQV